jgi:predicted RNA methylase
VKNKTGTKNDYVVYKEVYNICISAINIMRPLNCMEIYTKYNAKRVLNFCAGWGGSTMAAAALHLPAFYGVEINADLKPAYDNMVSHLKSKDCKTQIFVEFADAAAFDYSGWTYDTVFSSPPYYFIEKYANNLLYESKADMDDKFYKPVFSNTYNGLQKGGHYIINVCKEVYDRVLKDLLGEAIETFPLKKSKRQNDYTEMVYVWRKPV